MQEVHGVMTHIPSQIQGVVCKLWAQVVSTNQSAQNMLCWSVQDEASACFVIMIKQEDHCLQDVLQYVSGHLSSAPIHLQSICSVGLFRMKPALTLSSWLHIKMMTACIMRHSTLVERTNSANQSAQNMLCGSSQDDASACFVIMTGRLLPAACAMTREQYMSA